jgi:hypothetical protein
MGDDKQTGGLIASVKNRIARGVKDRASWALDGNKIATDGVQDKTKKQIASVLQATIDDPKAVADLGLRVTAGGAAPPMAAADVPDLDAKDLATLACEGFSRGCVYVARRAGFSVTVAPLAEWSKDERASMIPSIAKLINKWVPKDLGKWAEEIEAGTKLLAILIVKWQLLREASQKEAAEARRPAA